MSLNKKVISSSILALVIIVGDVWADAPCLPCGEVIINSELPTPADCNRVAPFQNFLATTENCIIRGTWSGFYIGTGAGFGSVNYNLTIPGITPVIAGKNINSFKNSYMTEYASVGYSYQIRGFFLAAELAYYYQSTTPPLYYEDPSFTNLVSAVTDTDVTITPCTVRLDINAHNHAALDFMPGFIFSNRLALYGRVGVEYSNYSWQRRLCFPDAGVISLPLVGDVAILVDDDEFGDLQSDSAVDFRFGAGVSFAVSPHVSFNVDYIHITGSKMIFTPNATALQANVPIDFDIIVHPDAVVTTNLATLEAENRISPTRNEVLFGVRFVF